MDDLPTQRVVADEGDVATVCVPLPQVEFNRYELVRELGKGGTGVVWLAQDRVLGAQVALKTLRPEITSEPSALRELKGEVLINRTLSHPNVVKTFDFVTNGRASAISMEYVSGTNLHRLKADQLNGFFEVEDIAKWMFQLCSAMDYAHGRNVVHRDIKPANLMIDDQGDLKVGDFGIGRTVAETSALTRNSSGTPPFMSPQQTMGERAVPGDDIYSIGATIYDLLTGDPPFFRGAIREQALAKLPPRMAERRKELGRNGRAIPPEWEAAVAAALSKEAAGRPRTAAALRALLEGTPTPSAKASPKPRTFWKWLLLPLGVAISGLVVERVVPAFAKPSAGRPNALSDAVQKLKSLYRKEPAPEQPTAADAAASRTFLSSLPQPRTVVQPSTVKTSGAGPASIDDPFFSTNGSDYRAAAPSRPPSTEPPSGASRSDAGASALERIRPDGGDAPSVDRIQTAGLNEPGPAQRRTAGQSSPRKSDSGRRAEAAAPLTPLEQSLASGQITTDEADLLRRALAGQLGDAERVLADRLILQRSLSPADWRNYSALSPPAGPVVTKLRPLLSAGAIREKEFGWLAAALAGSKGDAEQALAENLVDSRDLTPAQWRAQTSLYPPPPVDPIVEKIKPFLTSGRITAEERGWLDAALRGKGTSEEKGMAEQLLDRKSLTPLQWRARTSLAYPVPAGLSEDPAGWPPAIDLPLAGNVVMRLLRIDPGVFLRGTAEGERGRRTNEPAPAPVRIEQPYYLGVTEVTQAQYTALMPRNPSYWRGHSNWPIDQVDWQSLTGPGGFLDRMNHVLAQRGITTWVADLPTSDEWEYAARAGTQSSFYQGGPIANLQRDATLDRLANYNRSDAGSPQPVGSYLPNAWGLYDMLGNVSEWCRNRTVRGGSWQSSAAGCRIGWHTQSNEDSDTDPSPTQGFRLALRAKAPGL